uniref:Uncharacterized protein n=1 Tax=viral metagenome TaxID=1070528 RepID=A0A6M3K7L3_9ZZZZ
MQARRRIFFTSEVAAAAGLSGTFVRRVARQHGIGDKGFRGQIAFLDSDLPRLEKHLRRPIVENMRKLLENAKL